MLLEHSEYLPLSAYQFCLSRCCQYIGPMRCSLEGPDDQDLLRIYSDRREVIQHTPGRCHKCIMLFISGERELLLSLLPDRYLPDQ